MEFGGEQTKIHTHGIENNFLIFNEDAYLSFITSLTMMIHNSMLIPTQRNWLTCNKTISSAHKKNYEK